MRRALLGAAVSVLMGCGSPATVGVLDSVEVFVRSNAAEQRGPTYLANVQNAVGETPAGQRRASRGLAGSRAAEPGATTRAAVPEPAPQPGVETGSEALAASASAAVAESAPDRSSPDRSTPETDTNIDTEVDVEAQIAAVQGASASASASSATETPAPRTTVRTTPTAPERSAIRSNAPLLPPEYLGGVSLDIGDGLISHVYSMNNPKSEQDLVAYGECVAAFDALERGAGFIRHVRTLIKKNRDRWSIDTVYTISSGLPEGTETLDADAVMADCLTKRIPVF